MGWARGPGPRAPPSGPGQTEPSPRELYERGRSYREFLSQARRRLGEWRLLDAEARVPDNLAERARTVGGTWRFLAVAEDWCGDSASNLPYLAKLIEAVEGLDLRIVDSNAGRALMEAHRTPDGRPATPTFLLLDSAWNEVGCFVERPASLVAWQMKNRATMTLDEIHEHVAAWYEADRGRGTLTDIVELLELASAGRPRRCAPAGGLR